jgi:hypothetical protein
MNDVIKNLYILFDAAFEENMNGRGTDITRMVTTYVLDAIQNLQACEEVKYADWVFEVDWAGNGGTSCSGCNWASDKNDYYTIRYKRCPNCGAHMKNCIR